MDGDFLQSKDWEEFQKKFHRRVFRVGEILTVERKLPFGKKWWYTPRIQNAKFKIQNQKEIKEQFEIKELPVFWKVENINPDGLKFEKRVSDSRQPEKTLILDLSKSERELLEAMHQKTRYNIRLAEKKGVKIINDNGAMDTFWRLMNETTDRDQFSSHSYHYYEKILEMLPAKLWLAQFETKILASALILYYNDTAYYLHGASSSEHRETMSPYLLHWKIIEDAKRKGLKFYDLWGIDEKKWPGVTRFKRGFGGIEKDYQPAVDLIFQPFWYRMYLTSKLFKK